MGQGDGLRTHTGDAQEVGQAWGQFGLQLLQQSNLATAEVFLDLGDGALADAGEFGESPLLGEFRRVFGEVVDRAGHAAVAIDAKAVLAADLQQVGDPIENAGEFGVAHVGCGFDRGGVVADTDPNGIRTRVAGLKSRCPRPLDDGAAGPPTSAKPNPMIIR